MPSLATPARLARAALLPFLRRPPCTLAPHLRPHSVAAASVQALGWAGARRAVVCLPSDVTPVWLQRLSEPLFFFFRLLLEASAHADGANAHLERALSQRVRRASDAPGTCA